MAWYRSCLLAVLLWSGLGATPAAAADYYDPRNGFTLTLPPGWSQLSEQETTDTLESLKKHSPGIQLRAAFRSGAGDFPHMLVSEIPIENASLERVAATLGSTTTQVQAQQGARASDTQLQELGVPSVDERRQMVLFRSRTDQALSLSALFPGRISVVQVMVVFAPDAKEADLAPFEAIASSFRFEEGRGYAPRRGIPREWLMVLAFGVICFHGWRRAARREQPGAGERPLEPSTSPEST